MKIIFYLCLLVGQLAMPASANDAESQQLSHANWVLVESVVNSCTLPGLGCHSSTDCCSGYCNRGRCTNESGRVCDINGFSCERSRDCCSYTCRRGLCVGQ